jgi:hypothetical protein
MSALYERDFYAWANEQVELLRNGKLAAADIANIAEEIESMGRSEKRELVSRLTVLLLHLLKWRFQPERRGVSWDLSMKPLLPEAMATAYRRARRNAALETDLPESTFPADCPWTFDQAMQAPA